MVDFRIRSSLRACNHLAYGEFPNDESGDDESGQEPEERVTLMVEPSLRYRRVIRESLIVKMINPRVASWQMLSVVRRISAGKQRATVAQETAN